MHHTERKPLAMPYRREVTRGAPPRRAAASIKSARDAAMCALYREGATLSSIGALFGLSYERVRRVAAAAGLSKRNAGLSARRAEPDATKNPEVACSRVYGCSLDEVSTASPEERRAFLQHRKNVRRSGAAWQLSLSEWRALWQASGKWAERGRGPNKYGMTRVDIRLPVEHGNLQIVTNRDALTYAREQRGER